MVVWHMLAEHVTPNEATSKRGSAAAMSEMLSSVKLKAHLGAAVKPFEQADVNLREIKRLNGPTVEWRMGILVRGNMPRGCREEREPLWR